MPRPIPCDLADFWICCSQCVPEQLPCLPRSGGRSRGGVRLTQDGICGDVDPGVYVPPQRPCTPMYSYLRPLTSPHFGVSQKVVRGHFDYNISKNRPNRTEWVWV